MVEKMLVQMYSHIVQLTVPSCRKYVKHFLIKLTPVNPTLRSQEASLVSAVDPYDYTTSKDLITLFRKRGYEVILSIGALEENQIGSNCGQFIQRALNIYQRPEQSYDLERYFIKSS